MTAFTFDKTSPADNALVSQFPLNERAMRTAVDGWTQVDHDLNGHHIRVSMVPIDGPYTFDTGTWGLVIDTSGNFLKQFEGGTPEFVNVPVGTILPYAGSGLPAGYLLCDGSIKLRASYPLLFTAIGATWGSTDSTNFKVPDLRGRVVVGKDDMGGTPAGRINVGVSGLVGTALGATGGLETQTLTIPQLPNFTVGGTVTSTLTMDSYTPVGSFTGDLLTFTPTGSVNISLAGGSVALTDNGHVHGIVNKVNYSPVALHETNGDTGTFVRNILADAGVSNTTTTLNTADITAAFTASPQVATYTGGVTSLLPTGAFIGTAHVLTGTIVSSFVGSTTGQTAPHPIVQPSAIVNFIIKS